ncbi:MAG: hypothetical protein HQL72_02930 [Magnetococcales bacterium]|nr:hypothetical protein [Magnetococcales bacterium]
MKVKKIWFRENRLIPQLQPKTDQGQEDKIRALRQDILTLLVKERFISFVKQPKFLFDNKLNCLWLTHGFQTNAEEMFKHLSRIQIYTFKHWEMPSVEELRSIAKEKAFESLTQFKNTKVYTGERFDEPSGTFWTVTVGSGATGSSNEMLPIIPLHRIGQRDIFSFVVAHSLLPKGVKGVTEKLNKLYQLTMELSRKETATPPPSLKALKQQLLEGDYIRARLPVLEESYLHDMEKGLWELYQPEKPIGVGWTEVELKELWEARNPELDIRDGVVTIDFGTSSTVVACREHGKTALLRVGMTDFFRKPLPEDYQNPTILEFINLPNLLSAWRGESHRPLTRWDDFHFAHEALADFRENEANQRIVASMLTSIKQWPLLAEKGQSIRITDQVSGDEVEISPEMTPAPVPGQRLITGKDDPFNPIELYAYYLGLFINNRSNGIFLEYYMTFPVTYSKEVKSRILNAFSRGLMRSLPLAISESDKMSRFQLHAEASEPAAYAACALGELDIEPTPDGTAYAVFDFGGGSTDFDFGLYRTPTKNEIKQGYERAINHFGASGDMYLGGENLVANLAYQAFCQNLEVCREHKIPFSCPPEGERFPGHELFLDNSHVAQTNSALLMAKVRPIWENFQWNVEENKKPKKGNAEDPAPFRRLSDRIADILCQTIQDRHFSLPPNTQSCLPGEEQRSFDMELLNRDRQKVKVTLTLDINKMNHYLVARVGKGIHLFFIAMKQAFTNRNIDPAEIHVLMAGNASRALLVQALFAALAQTRMFKWEPPPEGLKKNPVLEEIQESMGSKQFIIHRPPPGDPENPYKPTAKTGVAIGLLQLIPGEPLLVIGPNAENSAGEAPFRFFVGRLENGLFQPALRQNGPYQTWQPLGVPTRGTFVLVHSTSPQAGLGELPRGSQELRERSLGFGRGSEGKQLFIRAITPSAVEVCLADSLEQIEKRPEETTYRNTIKLQ